MKIFSRINTVIRYQYSLLLNLNKLILSVGLFSLALVILIEFGGKKFLATSGTLSTTFSITLKFAYSLTASCIFFYINQHLPKEAKKRKYFSLIILRLSMLENTISSIFQVLGLVDGLTIDELETVPKKELFAKLQGILNKLDYTKPIFDFTAVSFHDTYDDFLLSKKEPLLDSVTRLLQLQENLNPSIIEVLSEIEFGCLHMMGERSSQYDERDIELNLITLQVFLEAYRNLKGEAKKFENIKKLNQSLYELRK